MQGQFSVAWRHEAVRRMGKQFPTRPEELWREEGGRMTAAQMIHHAKQALREK